jgi:hypothetical protein
MIILLTSLRGHSGLHMNIPLRIVTPASLTLVVKYGDGGSKFVRMNRGTLDPGLAGFHTTHASLDTSRD